MNEKIPIYNNTAMPIYVGGAMIPPGETRHFDIEQVPHHLRPAAPAVEEEVAPNPLADILGHSVKDIVAMLPALHDDDLVAIGEAEQRAEKPRTTLLGAIAEEQLKRAEAKAAGGNGDGEVGAGAGGDGAGGDGSADGADGAGGAQ